MNPAVCPPYLSQQNLVYLKLMCCFRASSVLQKNSKLYGPMNAIDFENSTTCWSSNGSPAGKQPSHYIVDFGRLVEPSELRVQYQAGFIGEDLNIFWQNGGSWKHLAYQEVGDNHNLQTFSLVDGHPRVRTTSVKLVFDECTDFYGRVTLYQVQIWGFEVEGEVKRTDDSMSTKDGHGRVD